MTGPWPEFTVVWLIGPGGFGVGGRTRDDDGGNSDGRYKPPGSK